MVDVPLPVIADTFRITILWNRLNGVEPRNVFHVQSLLTNETDVGGVIDDAIATLAVKQRLFDCMPDIYTANHLDILKLDGSSATVNYGLTNELEGASGTDEFEPAPCGVLSLRTAFRGPRGRGRLYVGPVSEGAVAYGKLLTGVATNMVDTWTDLKDEMSTNGVVLSVASYQHADVHPVTHFVVSDTLGTQRRRQDQLR